MDGEAGDFWDDEQDADEMHESFIPVFVCQRHAAREPWPFSLVGFADLPAIKRQKSALSNLSMLNDPRTPPLPNGILLDKELTFDQLFEAKAARAFINMALVSAPWSDGITQAGSLL